MKKFLSIFFILALAPGFKALSQTNYASILDTTITTDNMFIRYDASVNDGTRFLSVKLTYKFMGKVYDAKTVIGDCGDKIEPGNEKKIFWYYHDDIAKGTDIKNVTVEVIASKLIEPLAAFTIISMSNNGFAPSEVKVKNETKNGSEYEYIWNFDDPQSGNNNKSTQFEPTHTYENEGAYTISLICRNPSLDLESKPFLRSLVISRHEPTVADFSYEVIGALPPYEVKFISTSKNADIFLWHFGDPGASIKNNTSDKANTSYKYKQAGTFQVKLSVKSSVSQLTNEIIKEVKIEGPEDPVPGFEFEVTTGILPAIASFKNSSSHSDSYRWDFGDPNSKNLNVSTLENPKHTYAKEGTYNVTLTASNTKTKKSLKIGKSVVIEGPPIASFQVDTDRLICPASVIFKNTSKNATDYNWNFDDPDSGSDNYSRIHSPLHTYKKAGKYTVKLEASNEKSGIKSSSTGILNIVDPVKPPQTKFKIENNNSRSPVEVKFINTTDKAVSYLWNFGDPASGKNFSNEFNPSHLYVSPGTYKVTLTATADNGLYKVYSDSVFVLEPEKYPLAKFQMDQDSVTGPATIRFINSSENSDSYEWNFGDSGPGQQNLSKLQNPTHTYMNPGQFKVTLKAKDITTGKISETARYVHILRPVLVPTASFTAVYNGEYAPLSVSFTNTSKNANSYKWNFGDSQSGNNESTGDSPVHIYTTPGEFTVTLEAINPGSGKTHSFVQKVSIPGNFKTFFRTFGNTIYDESAYSSVMLNDNRFLILINTREGGSEIIILDDEGKQLSYKKLNTNVFDIVPRTDKNGYILAGIAKSGELIVQSLDNRLNTGDPVIIYQNTLYPGFSFSTLHMTISGKDEIGIIANLVNDKGEYNIWFQNADQNGNATLIKGKTFKYSGFKKGNKIIPTAGGGYAITGFWQQDENSRKALVLGIVDNNGSGKMHYQESKRKVIGCDLIELPTGNFSILAAGEIEENPLYSELRLKLVNNEIAALECEVLFEDKIRTADLEMFPPRMILTKDGYIILSHVFTGTDSNIMLYWIDSGGSKLLRKEEIKRPGDQFGTGIHQNNDGSLMIIGVERFLNDDNAIILKTDPQGRFR